MSDNDQGKFEVRADGVFVGGKPILSPEARPEDAPMGMHDKRFWVLLTFWGTVFGYGLYALIDGQTIWGSILTPVGVAGLAVMMLSPSARSSWMTSASVGSAIVITWAAIGYQIYYQRAASHFTADIPSQIQVSPNLAMARPQSTILTAPAKEAITSPSVPAKPSAITPAPQIVAPQAAPVVTAAPVRPAPPPCHCSTQQKDQLLNAIQQVIEIANQEQAEFGKNLNAISFTLAKLQTYRGTDSKIDERAAKAAVITAAKIGEAQTAIAAIRGLPQSIMQPFYAIQAQNDYFREQFNFIFGSNPNPANSDANLYSGAVLTQLSGLLTLIDSANQKGDANVQSLIDQTLPFNMRGSPLGQIASGPWGKQLQDMQQRAGELRDSLK